jgi:hypothetical protein
MGVSALPPKEIGSQAYEPGRWAYASTYLLLPYEALRALGLPYLALWEIQLGLPASLLLLALAFLLLRRAYPWLTRRPCLVYGLLVLAMALVFVVQALDPAWFWGPTTALTKLNPFTGMQP